MSATLTLEPSPRLEFRASPELIAGTELLALPAAELEHAVEQELATNPALERLEPTVCPFCGDPLTGPRCLGCARALRPVEPPRAPPEQAAEPTPADVLLAELRLVVSSGDHAILDRLVGGLGPRGFGDEQPAEVAARLAVPVLRVEGVLAALRRHGPAGVAAADVRECLLLQLEALELEGVCHALARPIVEEHLAELAAGRERTIAGALGVTAAEIAAAVDFIRLRLRPFAALEPPEHARPLTGPAPDVIVRARTSGAEGYDVELVEPHRVVLALAPSFAHVDRAALSGQERVLVAAQLAQARTFIHRLERRWRTMRAVAEFAVERQREFVAHGPRRLHPLTRAAAAAELGVHESTVSRATAGRFVRLPNGAVVPFGRFFGAFGGAAAELAALVAAEERPRSDADLARALTRLGYPVARRTVAKYRDRLGIPPCARRERSPLRGLGA